MDISSYFLPSNGGESRGSDKNDGDYVPASGRSTRWATARSIGVDPRALYGNKRYDGDEEWVYKPRKSQRRAQIEFVNREEKEESEDEITQSNSMSESAVTNIMDTIINVANDVFEKFLKNNGPGLPITTTIEEEREFYYERSPSLDGKTRESEDLAPGNDLLTDSLTDGEKNVSEDVCRTDVPEYTGTPKESSKHRIVYVSNEIDELYAHCLDLGVEGGKMTKEALKNRLSYVLMRYILLRGDYYYKNLEHLNNMIELMKCKNHPSPFLLEKIVEIYKHTIVIHLEKLRGMIPTSVKRAGVLDFRALRSPESQNVSLEQLKEILTEFNYGHFVKAEEHVAKESEENVQVKNEPVSDPLPQQEPVTIVKLEETESDDIFDQVLAEDTTTADFLVPELEENVPTLMEKPDVNIQEKNDTTNKDIAHQSDTHRDRKEEALQPKQETTETPVQPLAHVKAENSGNIQIPKKPASADPLKIPKKPKAVTTLADIKGEAANAVQTKHFGYRPRTHEDDDADSFSSMSSVND
ncbi:hypothetical protein BEWA_026920 [Theileria equi strain WA]|uniref:Uncharacterized protein n=1 Tax=Theileria equi strain WA TaxID=1537102 RepID=L0AX68_THEEQ|nr:hypothetical protein BEWA_026920 [Theileria equi strain WA]AFZ79843.1 hypothetical protein BEWA_026920 [Theileria equi strain WA]|eukprot:XP_004829509.1 hypothetical protein BEWA_026920 [Theileria equi strain WA]